MTDYTIIGGELFPGIILSFTGTPPVSDGEIAQQAELHENAALPDLGGFTPTGRKLAVVGGGPSLHQKLDVLRNWDGDIWAINSTWHFLNTNGIKSWFFALDPHHIVGTWAMGVKRALIASRVHPSVIEELKKASAEFYVFSIDNGFKIRTGSSTATAAVHLAAHFKYEDLTLFGCESSYPANRTHAHMHEVRLKQMIVEVNGGQFLTAPDYLVQAVELSAAIRLGPHFIKQESGGLLEALVADQDYKTVWLSQPIADELTPKPEPPALPSDILIRKVA